MQLSLDFSCGICWQSHFSEIDETVFGALKFSDKLQGHELLEFRPFELTSSGSPPPTIFPKAMSSNSSFSDFIARGSARAARSGIFPNENQPSGLQFHIPAIATARSPTNQSPTNPSHTTSVTSINHDSQRNIPTGTGAPAGSDPTEAAATSEANDTTNHINTLANLNIGDTADSDGDHDISSAERTIEVPDSDLDDDNARRENDIESLSSADLLERSSNRKRKRNTGSKSKSAPRKPRQAVPKSRRIAPRKVTSKEKPSKPVPRLKSSYFATKAYKASNGVHPIKQLFKSVESNNHPGTTPQGSKVTLLVNIEFKDLTGLLGELIPLPHKTYLESMGDTSFIDRMIILGLKLSNKKGDADEGGEGDDDDAGDNEEEEPVQQPEGGANTEPFVKYIGLNDHLPPMNNIHDIFADLTNNALGRGLGDFLEALGSGRLKVATLCSGTESPLLALQMVQDSEHMAFRFLSSAC